MRKGLIIMKTKKLLCLILLLALMVIMIGCETNDEPESILSDLPDEIPEMSVSPTESNIPDDDTQPDNADVPDFAGETLTVTVLHDMSDVMGTHARRYMKNNPGVTIELNNLGYTPVPLKTEHIAAIKIFRDQAAIRLMAGAETDVMSYHNIFDTLDPRMNVYFTDWFPLMAADPDFAEDDWYMNALDAFAQDGRLYRFPYNMSYFAVSVNNTIPGLREAFTGRDSITVEDMIDLYYEFNTGDQLFIEEGFGLDWIIMFFLHEFIDLESGKADFDNQRFIDLLGIFRENADTNRNPLLSWEVSEIDAHRSEKYFFTLEFHRDIGSIAMPLIGQRFERPLFTDTTPLVNEKGEVFFNAEHHGQSFVLNANSSPIEQALAWDFVKYMHSSENIDVYATSLGLPFQSFSPNRNHLLHGIEEFLKVMIQRSRAASLPVGVTVEEGVEIVWPILNKIGEMPMTRTHNAPEIIVEAINEYFEPFELGFATAEQTARSIQGRVELILMEMF
jgi:ABC-type glycerol-3-phosphate transport system substrate-binding protein